MEDVLLVYCKMTELQLRQNKVYVYHTPLDIFHVHQIAIKCKETNPLQIRNALKNVNKVLVIMQT